VLEIKEELWRLECILSTGCSTSSSLMQSFYSFPYPMVRLGMCKFGGDNSTVRDTEGEVDQFLETDQVSPSFHAR
jgi:hypothetical protein